VAGGLGGWWWREVMSSLDRDGGARACMRPTTRMNQFNLRKRRDDAKLRWSDVKRAMAGSRNNLLKASERDVGGGTQRQRWE
jgi:hypothetical protein